MLFATDKEVGKWTIFFGASIALVATSAIGVLLGALSEYVNEKYLHYAARAGFINIGVLALWKA